MSDIDQTRAWLKRGTGSVAQHAFELGRALDEITRLRVERAELARALEGLYDFVLANTGYGGPAGEPVDQFSENAVPVMIFARAVLDKVKGE